MDQQSKPMSPDELASHQARIAMEGAPRATPDEALAAYVAHRTSIELANAIRETLPDVLPDEAVRTIADQWASSDEFLIRDGALVTRSGVPASAEVASRLRNKNVAETLMTGISEPAPYRAARILKAASQPPASRGIGLRPIGKRGA